MLECLSPEHCSWCTKRQLVRTRSSLLVTIFYKFTKHYNYLQAYLHSTQAYLKYLSYSKHIYTDTKAIKMPSSLQLE
jgi:hypothetical protein